MRIVIIGNSAASTAAIEAIREYDNDSSITQLADEAHPLYSRCLITYYLSGAIDRKVLTYRPADFHKKMKADIRLGSHVSAVDPFHQRVECTDGNTFDYDKLLIATGASAKIPANLRKDIDGVFVLRTMRNTDEIKKRLPQARNAVILGGGLVSMRAAEALSKCGLNVIIVIRSDRVLSQMVDYHAAQIIKARLIENNIQVMTQSDVLDVVAKSNRLFAVRTDQGPVLNCDLLIAAKGVNANTELIHDSDIKKRLGILTNPRMQTNYENIFAAGDVAETYDIAIEDYTINALWISAVQQGRVAGLNIIDKQSLYDGSLSMNSMNIFDIPLFSFGLTSPRDESKYTILLDRRPEQNIYKKIIISNNIIKGIILVGKIANAGVLLSLIRNRVDVSLFGEELLSDQFNFGTLLKCGFQSKLEMYHNVNARSILH